jgi:hypothetical protein
MEQDRTWLFPAIIIALVAVICATLLSSIASYPTQPSRILSLNAALTLAIIATFLRFLGYLFNLWRSGEEHPIAAMRSNLVPAAKRFMPVAAGFAILSIFFYYITFLKSLIPAIIPFWADEFLAATDRAIAVDAQAMAIAVAPALEGLGVFYAFWHAFNIGGIIWVLFWRQASKGRHIISFMLTWSIGMLLAYAFSSAGPIFTGLYDPAVAPESVRQAADFLWTNYQASGALIGGGISAFPSMHVAIAAWFAIVLADRGLTAFGFLYLCAVFACSVILGWHYVIDSVAGAGIAIAADRLSLAWLRRRERPLAQLVQPAAAN